MNRNESLDDLGNVYPEFKLEDVKKLTFVPPFEHPLLFLKLYWMLHQNEEVNFDTNKDIAAFLEKEIESGGIDPEIGLGFAIYSRGYLNAAVWERKSPEVLKSRLYAFNPDSGLSTAIPCNLNADGAFCVWELGIVDHEKTAWMKYLRSERTRMDKADYLETHKFGKLR